MLKSLKEVQKWHRSSLHDPVSDCSCDVCDVVFSYTPELGRESYESIETEIGNFVGDRECWTYFDLNGVLVLAQNHGIHEKTVNCVREESIIEWLQSVGYTGWEF